MYNLHTTQNGDYKVEKVYSAFLWKGKEGDALGAKLCWVHVCKPKMESGLGLKRLSEWNIACLARIVWMLFSRKDTLWIAWMRAYVLKGKSF